MPMQRTVLPDWFFGLVPPGWLPDRPREFLIFTQNILPLSAVVNAQTRRELVFSKRYDALVFGGAALVSSLDNLTIVQQRSGIISGLRAMLVNPGGDETYTSDFVPLENLFTASSIAFGGAGVIDGGAQLPALWPIPIPVQRGGSLMLTILNARGVSVNLRLSFWAALLFDAERRRSA